MVTPADKLAASLAVLKELQDAGRIALRASDMSRTHRERLVKAGFIKTSPDLSKLFETP